MSGATKVSLENICFFWYFDITPGDCRCVAQTEASFSSTAPFGADSFRLNGLRCVRVIKSNGLHKTRGHKAPWVCWQLWRTLFVFYSLGRVLFTALFTRYRSRSGWWDCWSVSGYIACLQVLSTEACIDTFELDMGCFLSFFLLFYFANTLITWHSIALEMRV